MAQKSVYRLVTVNTSPERSRAIVGRIAEALKDQFTIEHVGNCTAIDEVEEKVRQLEPDLLFSASMWSSEEAAQIHSIGKSINPGIKTYAVPQGLRTTGGPDAIVELLTKELPLLLE